MLIVTFHFAVALVPVLLVTHPITVLNVTVHPMAITHVNILEQADVLNVNGAVVFVLWKLPTQMKIIPDVIHVLVLMVFHLTTVLYVTSLVMENSNAYTLEPVDVSLRNGVVVYVP